MASWTKATDLKTPGIIGTILGWWTWGREWGLLETWARNSHFFYGGKYLDLDLKNRLTRHHNVHDFYNVYIFISQSIYILFEVCIIKHTYMYIYISLYTHLHPSRWLKNKRVPPRDTGNNLSDPLRLSQVIIRKWFWQKNKIKKKYKCHEFQPLNMLAVKL